MISFVLAQQEQHVATCENPEIRFTNKSVMIGSNDIPKSIEKGKNILVNIIVINQGKNIIKNLNMDVVSTGFKTLNKNPSINEIFLNSTIHNQYLLEATVTGKHIVYLNYVYTINPTEKTNSLLPVQVSDISDIGSIDVIEKPFYTIEWSSLFPGLISSLVGLVIGVGLTRLVERFKEKDIEKSQSSKLKVCF